MTYGMSSTAPSVTIVIPVYNEEEIIAGTLDTLLSFLKRTEFPYPYRITVVDNASTDRTARMVTEFAAYNPETTLLKLAEKGKGRAVRAGWAQEKGGILAFMDADLSSDIGAFKALVDAIANGSADLSIGNRLGKNSKIVSTKKFRKIVSRIYNALVRAFLWTGIDDHQCGFKALSFETFTMLAPKLTETEFFLDTELIALVRKQGLSIHQEDIVWIDSATSKVSLFSDSLKMFLSVVRLSWRLHV